MKEANGEQDHEIELLTEEEKQKLLIEWNDTGAEYCKDKCLHELFEEQARETPGKVAAVFEYQELTYRELDERSTLLAKVLQKQGVKPDRPVGICLQRSLEMILGILGILKAGGTYMPIDPEYPPARLKYILEDSEVKVLMTQEKLEEKISALPGHKDYQVMTIDKQWVGVQKAKNPAKLTRTVQPYHLAYVIYTSGSTGKPKGVIVEHRQILNTLYALQSRYPVCQDDFCLLKTNCVFDVSITELFAWFIGDGGLVILEPGQEKDPQAILKVLTERKVTHINFAPSMCTVFLHMVQAEDLQACKALKYVMVAGEAFPRRLARQSQEKFNPGVKTENIYGPTEISIYGTWFSVNGIKDSVQKVPIGTPLYNVQAYVLNQERTIQPIGVPGELHIGGAGLARGYLNQPELTAEKFILAHSSWLIADRKAMKGAVKFPMNYQLAAFSCIYKTGDLARWLPDGNIEFLGRMDHQVKIRGIRIELGEIEAELMDHPDIQEVVVIARNVSNSTQLVAYYVAVDKGKVSGSDEIRIYLKDKLPEYMIPAAFVPLEAIPLTPNGKVDRKVLGKQKVELRSSQEYTAPRTEVEKQLARIWEEVLGIEKVGIYDNFFELGGHSLLGIQIISRINKESGVDLRLRKLLYDAPSIKALSIIIGESDPYQVVPIASIRRPERLPLSYAQERLWFLAQLGYSEQYHIPRIMKIKGNLDEKALKKTMNFITARHEGLRTGFKTVDGMAIQVIAEAVDIGIEKRDVSGINKDQQERDCQTIIREFSQKPFDLEQAPLMRVVLIKLEATTHILGMCLHHIIFDGWSIEILTREISQAYAAYLEGKEPEIEELNIQYADYAVWQRQVMTEAKLDKELSYWQQQLAGYQDLDLPTDYTRPKQLSGKGGIIKFQLEKEQTRQLKQHCQERQMTLFTLLLASVYLLLKIYSRQEDICLGVPTANRNHQEIENLVGFFVNILVIRINPDGQKDLTVEQLLKKVREVIVSAQDRQNVPFEKVVEAIQPRRDLSRSVIFQVLVNYVNTKREELQLGDSQLEEMDFDYGMSKIDLTFTFYDEPGEAPGIHLNYSRDLYEEETIHRMSGHLVKIITSLVEEPGITIDEIELLREDEKQKLLIEWNNTAAEYPKDQCIHELFQEQVKKTPNQIALVFENQKLTYRVLDEKSSKLAVTLQKLGVKPDNLVGIYLERSLEMVPGILGTLKAGAAYLPIDPDYPQERIDYILADSNARVLLTTAKLRVKVKAEVERNVGHTKGLPLQLINIEKDLIPAFEPPISTLTSTSTCQVSPANLAYVIYTSGSTGKPKGVMVQHHSLTNHIESFKTKLKFPKNWDYILFSVIVFDASIKQVFIPLTCGARVHICKNIQDIDFLANYITTNSINVINAVPSLVKVLIEKLNEKAIGNKIECILIGGEKLDAQLTNKIKQRYKESTLINLYGPTETCVNSLYYEIKEKLPGDPPIGKALPNYKNYILDDTKNPLPIGIKGELCIAGDGLARGYLNQPELTAGKFCLRRPGGTLFEKTAPPGPPGKNFLLKKPDKNSMQPYKHAATQVSFHYPINPLPHHPIYFTGDLARWLPDGNIEFLGRIDQQVKIRGFRIECGEIETGLAQHPNIKEVVVIAGTINNEMQLIAYYVASDRVKTLEKSQIRNYLKGKLPEYMIPAAFVPLETIPLTPSGKVDRRALLKHELEMLSSQEYVAPRTGTEKQLASIWEEVLAVERVGIHDNFFELGGHSLLATQIISRINRELGVDIPLRTLYETSGIEGLSLEIKESHPYQVAAITSIQRPEQLPLSYAQERLWFLAQLGYSEQYHVPKAVKVIGDLHEEALQKAINFTAARHEILRTGFKAVDGRAIQVITPDVSIGLEKRDLSGLNKEQQEKDCQTIIREFVQRPFELSQAPLVRVILVKLDEDIHIFGICMHHIISDGWSTGILTREISRAYAAYTKGKEPELEKLKTQYADYAVWQREVMTEEELDKEIRYWKTHLAGYMDLDLPTDYPRPRQISGKGGHVKFSLKNEKTRELKKLCQEKQVTLFTAFMTSVYLLMRSCSRQWDICLGMPVANRNHRDIEDLIGFFVNTLVVRINTGEQGDITIRQLLKKVQEEIVTAQDHQDVPFEKVVETIQPTRDLSRTPIFTVMVTDVNTRGEELEFGENQLESVDLDYGTSKFDLTAAFSEKEDGDIGIYIVYSQDLYQEKTIERIGKYLVKIMTHLVEEPGKTIDEIELPGEEEKQKLLIEWNNTAASYPKDQCIHDLFRQQVKKTPENIAVVFEDQELSYWELDERSTGLALYLQIQGIKPDCIVGICLEQSLEMIVGILGILKAGGAYLPIDQAYPGARIRYMLTDSNVRVLLTTANLQVKVKAEVEGNLGQPPGLPLQCINIETDLTSPVKQPLSTSTCRVSPTNLAYVIYTSGSTGKPKGVMVEHSSVINLSQWHIHQFKLSPGDSTTLFASFGFDAAVWELFPYLLNGNTLHLLDDQVKHHPDTLNQYFESNKITIAFLPTQFCEQFFSLNNRSLRILLTGGDQLNRFPKPGVRYTFFNNYGPTENTVVSSCTRIDSTTEKITIGKPVQNTQFYILNENLIAVPIGMPGELHISGAGLARGYLNQAELNQEKFIESPFKPGIKMYKSGDLTRWRPDGNIEFLGRKDHQVKIRGFRIECGEIEAVLANYPKVQDVVVIARSVHNSAQLVAYYVAIDKGQVLEVTETRSYLQAKLPEYMIPAAFVSLEAIPLTPSGKVDRKALLRIEVEPGNSREYIAPRTGTQKQLARIWEEVLGAPRVGIHDNFFELGGHSLLATQIISRINKELEVEVPLGKLFEVPRLESLSRVIEESKPYRVVPLVPFRRTEQLPLSYAQERLWFLARLGYSEQYHVPNVMKIKGDLDEEALQKAINFITARHESLRTGFKTIDSGAIQVIEKTAATGIEQEDLSGLGEEEQDRESQIIIREFVQRPFKLEQAPLMRVLLIKLASDTFIFGMCMHHIVSDGWSMGILTREITRAYAAYKKGKEPGLEPLKVQYADYAVWQRAVMTEAKLNKELTYWKEQLTGYEDLDLPTDYPRPKELSGKGGYVRYRLEKEQVRLLTKLGQEKQMTLFTLLMASVYILLRRYSQQGDICLGMPTANRNHRDIENLVGFFINTLVIRIDTGEKTVITVEQLLNKVQDGLVAAQDQQDMPFEKVVESIQPTRDLSRTPIFQVLVNYVNTGREELQFGDSTLEEVEIDYGLSKFDLTFAFVHQEDNSLGINIKYSRDLYREETIERMGGHLVKIMNNLVKDRGKAIDEIELLSWQEKEKILVQWNKNEMEYPKDKCIHELFWEQVKKTPNQVAVVLKDQKLTYRELDERSTRLALVLQKRGIISDRLVGICLERSLEMIIGILGILKAGGAYVPIDPEYPEERIRYMLINSDVTVLLAQEKMEEKVPGLFSDKTIEVIVLDKQWDKIEKAKGKLKKEVQSFHLAYVIYTSGSTGKPKGVMVQHHGVVNYLNAVKNKYGFAEIDMEAFNFSFLGNFVFDAVATSFLTPLISGGVCILYGQHEDQQDTIRKALNNPQVQVIKLTPSHLQLIRDSMPIQFKSPKFLIIGGESLKKSLVQELVNKNGNNVYCINQYGPTECTIASTAHLYNRDINYRNEVYIGHPIANTRIYILNNINKAVPVGVPGELHIAGDGLARGYLNQPELTAEKFILAHSSWLIADRKAMKGAAKFPMNYQLSAFNCIYKTGDLSRWLPDGNIEFLGRIDHQVKIRGFRIECGEIETVLAQHPKIQETVVIARTINNMTQLVAYYVKIDKDKTLEVSETRSYLQGKLPEYMIPAAFVSLEEIPLTPNGKVDGKALLQIEVGLESSQEYVAPRTKTEKQLTRIWKNVLGVPRVGIHDNFFELGGHSLLATQIISRINRELKVDVPLRKLFDTPRIEDLSRAIAESAPYQMIPIASIRRPEQLPLSYAQERLWFLARLGYSEQYHVPKVVKVIGELDEEALQKAINFIAARHENLRTGFKIVDGRAIQVIAATVDFGIEKKDLSGLSKEEQERDCQTIIREFVQRPFELSQPPLVRVILVKLNTDIHILGICMHHIISDGWSGGILTREISQAYAASRKGKEPGLAPLKVQYADYAVWQREVMTEARLDQELKYWKEHLAGYEDLDLPTDFPRPRQISGKGGHVSLRLQSETAQQLKKLSQKEQITLFTVFMTSVYLLLRRYSRQEDICLGMPVANRNYQEIEDLVGFFANTLVIRIITGESQGITLRRLLKKVQQEIATAQDRQNVPFEKVVETIQPTRDLSRTPIFQVLVNYVNTRREKLQLGESRLEGVEFEYGISKFDLMFAFGDQEDDSLAIAIQYNRDLYREETICRMGGHLVKIIDSLIEEPGKGAEKIELLTEQEKQKLLIDWNHTAAQYPGDQCLHELFRQQVKKTPGKVAVVFADRILTYRELEKRSTGLAKTLQKKGIPPHGLVGVCLERSIETIVGILGILKAGGAYLPIDPDYPRERIGYILADSNARVLLTTAKLQVKAEVEGNVGRTKGLPIQFINIKADPIPAFEPPDSTLTSTCKVSPTNLAYIIYTSGSTGKPKGVMQTHQTITNLIEFQKRSNPLSPTVQTHVAQFAAHGFDVSIQEIFYTLFNGGVLYILTEETKQSPTEVICFVNRRQINILYLPTAYLEYFSAAVNDHRNIGLKSLERIIVAGEALKIYPSIKNFFTAYTHILLENQYGPSETHVVTRYVLSEDKEQWQYLPPIGHPIANIGIYILSLMNQLVPIGVPGELHIAGDGLARGYLNNPEMTAEKFDHDFLDYQDYQDGYHRSHQKKMPGKKYLPMQSCSHATMQLSPRHSPHYPIYHTGDLARWLPDGNISFLGRIDHQVKVRGFRIECGEIEAELAQHPRVREAVVIARTIGNTVQLIAYYVPVNEDQVIEVSEARNYLQGKLPEYMVPAAFISLQTIPLTANGKVDRKSLLKQELELESRQEYIAPQTETEKQLAGIWKEVLGLEKVGIHDNFFELGGHSLLAIQIISRINKELRINVPLRKLFEAPNIKALSDIAAGCEHTSTEDQITGFVESITEITI